ncbi:hypothetical protein C8Q76DRAFT_714476 [Earliella scabrosa]|nr:hypothetical protein C8Q76DRAFT_714476 [Earliella scabrosa]
MTTVVQHRYTPRSDSSISNLARFCGWRTGARPSFPSRSASTPPAPWRDCSSTYFSWTSHPIFVDVPLIPTT